MFVVQAITVTAIGITDVIVARTCIGLDLGVFPAVLLLVVVNVNVNVKG